MDRRHLLHLGVMGLGSALVTHQVGSTVAAARLEEELAAAQAVTRAEVQAQAAAERELFQVGYEARIQRLEQELAIYEAMDNIGLDRLIDGALDTYERIWLTVRVGLIHLRQGVGWVDETLTRFEEDLPTLRGAARTVAELLLALDDALTRLRDILAVALKRTEPITDLVGGFFSWVLDHVPFGLGGNIRDVVDRFGELVGIAPAVVQDTDAELLRPLHEQWLSEEQDQGLQGGLFAPLRDRLLTPVAEYLERLERMSNDWEQDATPLRTALAERNQARERLAALRADASLPAEDGGPA